MSPMEILSILDDRSEVVPPVARLQDGLALLSSVRSRVYHDLVVVRLLNQTWILTRRKWNFQQCQRCIKVHEKIPQTR